MNRLDDHDWGLEDRLLRTNIPGRFSWWDKDADEVGDKARAEWIDPKSDEAAAFAAQNDMQKMKWCADNDVPEPLAKNAYARQTGAKTGPKGVLADYKQHREDEFEHKLFEERYRQAVLNRMALGARVEAPTPAAEESEEDSEDEEFMRAYREERRRELTASHSHPVFGGVREVTAFQFLDEIDKEDIRVFVVVHIYNDRVKSCRTLNRCFEELARSHAHVKFLRLASSESPQEFDEVAFPVLSVYRAGDLVDTWVRITDRLGECFTADDVEWLLSPLSLFDASSLATRSKGRATTATLAGQALARATEEGFRDAVTHTQELFDGLSEDESGAEST